MAATFRPAKNYGQAESPGRRLVKLEANINAELGKMIVVVAGFGKLPVVGDAATGRMAGVVEEPADNTGGAQGAKSIITRPGVYSFANSGANPCAQANVGATVYAEDGDTIGTNLLAGPKAGTLIEFDSSDPQGRPCKVALICDAP